MTWASWTNCAIGLMMCSIVCATGQCEGVLKAGPWLGFRYNDQEVLVYTDQMRDSAEHRMDEVDRLHLPDPRAKWGGGGNLLPLTAERLSHFDALVPGKGSVTASVNKGTRMSVQVSADETIEGTVDRLVEQWGMDNLVVRVGFLLKIRPEQMAAFQSITSDYFLVSVGPMRDVPVLRAANTTATLLQGTRVVLNDLGSRGQIVVVSAEKGWEVALWRKTGGGLQRTEATYYYGD